MNIQLTFDELLEACAAGKIQDDCFYYYNDSEGEISCRLGSDIRKVYEIMEEIVYNQTMKLTL